ncbi:MAG TPA: ABC transporter ATP-binding protein [Anaerolineae bacterium]|nr:ABC transporter ATP-binding protein [Anaerolineae bacterium]
MSVNAAAVSMRGIVKRFPGVVAVDGVDLTVQPGEIHALLGENGAGKSSLMNVLAGLYRPDAGEISVQGRPADIRSPRDATRLGIGMVHQHFMLVQTLSVAENIILGLPRPRFRLNMRTIEAQVRDISTRYGLHVDPSTCIWQLSVGEQQRVEILKLLYRGANILILDEPTAVLAPQEIEELCQNLRAMAAEGKSVILISHKLTEVLNIADRITVLRKGRVTASGIRPADTNRAGLARLMVDRPVLFALEREAQAPGEAVLVVDDLSAQNDKGLPALRGISFEVRAGEVLGLAGVAGNGQRELAEVITGLRPATGGRILLNNQNVTNKPPRRSLDLGLSHVPEDRVHVGLIANMAVSDNLILKGYRRPPLSRLGFLVKKAIARFAGRLIEDYQIDTPGPASQMKGLSGGNLQKALLAREISHAPRAMIAMQPTRGLDVGAIEAVHRLLLDLRRSGAAILLVSEELDEITSLSDRIAVIYEGQIMGTMPGEDADVEKIGLMMAGTAVLEPSTG